MIKENGTNEPSTEGIKRTFWEKVADSLFGKESEEELTKRRTEELRKRVGEEEQEEETYSVETDCENCLDEITVDDIPFGKKFKDHIKGEICGECGCPLVENNKEEMKNDKHRSTSRI